MNVTTIALIAIATLLLVAVSVANVVVAFENKRNAEENLANALANVRMAETNMADASRLDAFYDGYRTALSELRDVLVGPGDLGDADDDRDEDGDDGDDEGGGGDA